MTWAAPPPALNPYIEADLQLLNEAHAYRAWLYDVVRPHLGQRILEMGAGIGNYTEMLLDRELVWATDYDDSYVRRLAERFAQQSNIVSSRLDLSQSWSTEHGMLAAQQFDTVLVMNVLEHIEDDRGAIERMRDSMAPGGRLVICVPAMQQIFGTLDEAYGHFRRYGVSDFEDHAAGTGLTLEHCQHFNLVGILGWLYTGRLRRLRYLPRGGTRLFDALAPLLRRIEQVLTPPRGLSLVAVLRKDAIQP